MLYRISIISYDQITRCYKDIVIITEIICSGNIVSITRSGLRRGLGEQWSGDSRTAEWNEVGEGVGWGWGVSVPIFAWVDPVTTYGGSRPQQCRAKRPTRSPPTDKIGLCVRAAAATAPRNRLRCRQPNGVDGGRRGTPEPDHWVTVVISRRGPVPPEPARPAPGRRG